MGVRLRVKIKLCNLASPEVEVVHNLNLNSHKLAKQSKMMDPNQKEVDFQTISRTDSLVKLSNSNQTMVNNSKGKVINKLVKTNITSIWMLRSNLNRLKTIMEYQSKEAV